MRVSGPEGEGKGGRTTKRIEHDARLQGTYDLEYFSRPTPVVSAHSAKTPSPTGKGFSWLFGKNLSQSGRGFLANRSGDRPVKSVRLRPATLEIRILSAVGFREDPDVCQQTSYVAPQTSVVVDVRKCLMRSVQASGKDIHRFPTRNIR